MNDNPPAPGTNPVDLNALDRESDHTPGSVQPHGVMLVLHGPEMRVVQVSENCAAFLGHKPPEIVGQPLARVIAPADVLLIREAMAHPSEGPTLLPRLATKISSDQSPCAALLHRVGDLLILELEPVQGSGFPPELSELEALAAITMARLHEAKSLEHLCQLAAEQIARITGFDRVMVYRFDAQWNGQVIAEKTEHGLPSQLGLWYPASDIPSQARRLCRINPIGVIPDVEAPPAPLLPAINPVTGQTLDLTRASLRSVGSAHLESLRHMQARASMFIALTTGDRLWGLIACHHRTPRRISLQMRGLCQLLGQVLASEIERQLSSVGPEQRAHMQNVQQALIQRMTRNQDPLGTLIDGEPNLGDFLPSSGVCCYTSTLLHISGTVPQAGLIHDLVHWLDENPESVVHTDRLSQVFAEAECHAAEASGLLAVRLSRHPSVYLLWFRPERVRTLRWAGQPDKAIEPGDDAQQHPHRSRAVWQQQVRQTSEPWEPFELQAVQELRTALIEVLASRQAEMIELAVLERSSSVTHQFTSIMSHDVRQPLAAVSLYLRLVLDSNKSDLDPTVLMHLKTCQRLADEAMQMIKLAVQHSRAANAQLTFESIHLDDVVNDAIRSLAPLIEQNHAQVVVHGSLPTIVGDAAKIGDVFKQLIANGILYNQSPAKLVEIGCMEGSTETPPAFYVRDNGAGMAPASHQAVFDVFRRLPEHEAMAEGAGIGLPLVKAIVERHRGRIWIESELGKGSTFWFTLQAG